jgi:hypothetical protein
VLRDPRIGPAICFRHLFQCQLDGESVASGMRVYRAFERSVIRAGTALHKIKTPESFY